MKPIAPIAPAVMGSAFDPTATGNVGVTGTGGAPSTIISDPVGPAPVVPVVPLAGGAGQINQGNLLGQFDVSSTWKFLHAEGTMTSLGATGALGSSGNTIVVQAGGSFTEQFNIARGDKLDLSGVLAGAPIAQDLTNLSQFVKVVGHGFNDPGYGLGTKTTLEITGPGGSARIDLQGSGKLDLKDLLHHDSLLLPPH
jgi:hypothetical protein